MVSKTGLLFWCLVMLVCWMSETEAAASLNGNIPGKRSIMKVRLLLGSLKTYAPLIFPYLSVDMKSKSCLWASVSKALPINCKIPLVFPSTRSKQHLLTFINISVCFSVFVVVVFFFFWFFFSGSEVSPKQHP